MAQKIQITCFNLHNEKKTNKSNIYNLLSEIFQDVK